MYEYCSFDLVQFIQFIQCVQFFTFYSSPNRSISAKFENRFSKARDDRFAPIYVA